MNQAATVSPSQKILFAEQAFRSGRLAEAIDLCGEILAANADDAGAHYLLGAALFNSGKREEGILHVSKAVVLTRTNAAWYEELGTMHQITGNFDAAAEMYRCCTELKPGALPAWYNELYLQACRITGTMPFPLKRRMRFWLLLNAMLETQKKGVAGDVVECGCFRGLSSYLLCSMLKNERPNFKGESYHIFDSFEGLSEPGAEDAIVGNTAEASRLRANAKAGFFATPMETVRQHLAGFPEIHYHPGWIPNSFQGLEERAYAFVHIDVDLYAPTREAFLYFFPRLSIGGILVCDDYNWPGAKQAVEEFCASLPEASFKKSISPFSQAVIEKLA